MKIKILREATKKDLIDSSKSSTNGGATRFNKTKNISLASSTKEYNEIDMTKMFVDGIVAVDIKVKGETKDYKVRISFGGFKDILQELVAKNKGNFDLRTITKALLRCFEKNDVYVHCTCEDFKYTFSYYATENNYMDGEAQRIPPEVRNPQNNKGSSCKHVLRALSSNTWIHKVATVIKNYVEYMKKHSPKDYAKIIYPAIYNKEYEEPVQQKIWDQNKEAVKDENDIDNANEYADQKKANRKPPQKKGYKFAKKAKKENPDEPKDLTLFDLNYDE